MAERCDGHRENKQFSYRTVNHEMRCVQIKTYKQGLGKIVLPL